LSKPSPSAFLSDYNSYITDAADGTNLPYTAVATQWFQEWGIPHNNPANQGSTMGQCTSGTYGTFPIFCTLQDGVDAYIAQVNYSYNGGSNAFTSIYGQPVHWSYNYQWGFAGGQVATNKPTDTSGCFQTSTSQAFFGVSDIPSGASQQQIASYQRQAIEAVLEAMGASPWDYGHYWSCGDSYAGSTLVSVAIDNGWL